MKTIYKYPLEILNEQVVKLPWRYEVLCVMNQKEQIVLYAEVDTSERDIPVHVYIFGTGHDMHRLPPNAHYIGSVQTNGGNLVWHVYGTI